MVGTKQNLKPWIINEQTTPCGKSTNGKRNHSCVHLFPLIIERTSIALISILFYFVTTNILYTIAMHTLQTLFSVGFNIDTLNYLHIQELNTMGPMTENGKRRREDPCTLLMHSNHKHEPRTQVLSGITKFVRS
jgi:hypothetical protein